MENNEKMLRLRQSNVLKQQSKTRKAVATSHPFYTLYSTTTKMTYHGFLLILGNCQISKPLLHYYIQILTHKLTPKNNGNRRARIAYIFIRSDLPNPLYLHTALPPECLTLNLHWASRLLATLGGNSSHSLDYSNRSFYATLQNRFSGVLAAHCHHRMNLDSVTFTYSWRWYGSSRESGFSHWALCAILGD